MIEFLGGLLRVVVLLAQAAIALSAGFIIICFILFVIYMIVKVVFTK